MSEPFPVISIVFTSETVEQIAAEEGVDADLAFERVTQWANHIESTFSGHAYEQLRDTIVTGEP